MRQENTPQEKNTLPNFGAASIALRILIVAQCIAVILTIARNEQLDSAAWNDLILMTSFAQLVAIGSILVLKLIAKPIRSLHVVTGSIIVFSMLILATFLISPAQIAIAQNDLDFANLVVR